MRTLLKGLAGLGLVAYVPSMWLSLRVGLIGIAIVDTVMYALLLGILWFGAGRTRLQSLFLVTLIYALGAVLSVALGPAGAGPLWLAAVPVAAAVLFDRTGTWIALGSVALTSGGVATARGLEWVTWTPGVDGVGLWLVVAGNGVLLGGGLALAVTSLVRGLRSAAEQNARVSAELAREQDRLLEANRRLEQEADERHRAEQQLRQAEKLTAIGTLAAGIAHDFNNLLTPILAAPELLRDPHMPADEQARVIDGVESAACAGRELVQRILAFSRPSGEARRPLAAAAAFRDAVRLLRASLPASVALDVEIDEDAGHILLTPGEVHQIVLNLGSNAQKAMPEGGHLAIRVSEVPGESAAGWADGAAPDQTVRVVVSDTGTGMAPETVRRVFEPFFTTDQDRGTGMGLATVYGIVQSAAGTLHCDSTPGEGTTLTFFLPVVDAGDAPARAFTETEPPGHSAGLHVLLVDDEEPVRDVSARALRRNGCLVTAVGDAPAALHALADTTDINVMITDLNMPGMKGTALARRVRLEHPDVGIILMTGLVDEVLEAEARDIGVDRILAKPFQVRELLAALHHVAGRNHPA